VAHHRTPLFRIVGGIGVAALAVAAMGPGCGTADEAEPGVGLALEPIGVAALSLTVGPRALPGGLLEVSASATLAGLTPGEPLVLRFTGDRSHWPDADAPGVDVGGGHYTFAKSATAPARLGLHAMSWQIERASGERVGPEAGAGVEVTCSDGLFCNGEERFTKRGCVAGPPPCDDQVACTTDHCDEPAQTCRYEPTGPGCASCAAKHCKPKCGKRQQCGDDGCGGRCVTSATDAAGNCLGGQFCVADQCTAVSAPGTCSNPLPLFGAAGVDVPPAGIVTTVYGDTSGGLDAIKVSCGGDGIPEIVYRLDVPVSMGVDIRMLAASGVNDDLDTVLALHQADCVTQGPWPGFCADDSTPPGGLGSRVYGPVAPGSYRLVATGYSASQVGPFQLQVKLVPGCVPVCDGKYCGPDGCGGDCGACSVGEVCSAAGRCYTAPCTPDCQGRQCGDDGCGGTCGACGAGDSCAEADGKCVPSDACDHFLPVCKNCGPKTYCGSDCQCHKVDETLVDLVPAPASTLIPSIEFEWRTFDGSSCALGEGCVPAPGRWLLMRFTTDVLNQGLAGFKPGDPNQQPDLFDYDACHQHFHFGGFANYGLLSLDGGTVIAGRKQSYCIGVDLALTSTAELFVV
jgi:hypothetical protein